MRGAETEAKACFAVRGVVFGDDGDDDDRTGVSRAGTSQVCTDYCFQHVQSTSLFDMLSVVRRFVTCFCS